MKRVLLKIRQYLATLKEILPSLLPDNTDGKLCVFSIVKRDSQNSLLA